MNNINKEQQPVLAPYQASFVEGVLSAAPPAKFVVSAFPGAGVSFTLIRSIAVGIKQKRFRKVLYIGVKPMLELSQLHIVRDNPDCKCMIVNGRNIKELASVTSSKSSAWPDEGVCLTDLKFASRTGVDFGILRSEWDLVVVDCEPESSADEDQNAFLQDLTKLDGAVIVFARRSASSGTRNLVDNNPGGFIQVDWSVKKVRGLIGPQFELPTVKWTIVPYEMSDSELEFLELLFGARRGIVELSSRLKSKHAITFDLLLQRAMSSLYSLERLLMDSLGHFRKLRNAIAHNRWAGPVQLNLFEEEDYATPVTQMELFSDTADLDDIADIEVAIANIELALRKLETLEGDEKIAKFVELLRSVNSKHVVIITRYSSTLDLLETALEQNGIPAISISAKLPSEDAFSKVSSFCQNGGILVSTDASMQGFEFPSPSTVIHYDIPWTPNALAMRINRFQRYGKAGEIEMFAIVESNSPMASKWQELLRRIENIRLSFEPGVDEI
jgi:hypothetical protein